METIRTAQYVDEMGDTANRGFQLAVYVTSKLSGGLVGFVQTVGDFHAELSAIQTNEQVPKRCSNRRPASVQYRSDFQLAVVWLHRSPEYIVNGILAANLIPPQRSGEPSCWSDVSSLPVTSVHQQRI